MGRATRRGKSYAGLAAAGAGLMGMTQFISEQEKAKAQALKDANLMALKQQELGLAKDKMGQDKALADARLEQDALLAGERNALTKEQIDVARMNAQAQADQIAGLNARFAAGEKRNALTAFDSDMDKWRAKFLGKGEDAEFRSEVWSKALDASFDIGNDPEKVMATAQGIIEQFGMGADGQPVMTPEELISGMDYLQKRAKFHGLSPEDLSPEDIKALALYGLDVPDPADPETTEPGVDPEATGLMGTAEPDGPLYGGLSGAIFGEGGESVLRNVASDSMTPWIDRYNKGLMATPIGQLASGDMTAIAKSVIPRALWPKYEAASEEAKKWMVETFGGGGQ